MTELEPTIHDDLSWDDPCPVCGRLLSEGGHEHITDDEGNPELLAWFDQLQAKRGTRPAKTPLRPL
jgi:hypothetical protein